MPSPLQPSQPSIPKRKRKPVARKLKIASEEEEEEDVAVQKVLQLAREIEIPVEVLARESTVEGAQLGLEITENLQQMTVVVDLMEATEVVYEEEGCSEAPDASEALEGNSNSHTPAEIITVKSSSYHESRSSSASLSSYSSTSSDTDDVPLNKVYTNLYKSLSPSPLTKTHKKPDYDTFVPMYPSVEERLIGLQQRRINACIHLLADHPLQPLVIEAIQSIPADAESVDDHIGTKSANINVSSPHPTSPTQTTPTTETSEPSIIQNLVDHYSGELPEYESNLEKASDIASDEVMTEIPQQHEPNQDMTSSTNLDYVLILEPVPEQPVLELSVPKQIILNQQQTTNTSTEPETSINDQPSSSNLAILPVAPAKTNVPSPPTLFLDSTILADVSENIFQELNNLVQARNNLIYEDNYEKLWIRLKDRVEYVLTEL